MEDIKEFILDDTKYSTRLTKKWQNRKPYTKADPNEIRAYIPGAIIDIFVKPGQKVKENDSLLILEAMKMKNDVVAPHTGVVKEILIPKGERVEKNQLLMVIEPRG